MVAAPYPRGLRLQLGADGAQVQLNLINNDQQVLYCYFFLLKPIVDRLATEVHIRIRLEKDENPALVLYFADTSQRGILPCAFE